MILQRLIPGRIGQSARAEARAPQSAGVTAPTGAAGGVRLVTGHGLRVIDSEARAFADDLGLGETDERCLDAARLALDPGPGGEPSELCEGGDELGAAVGRAGRVGGGDPDANF